MSRKRDADREHGFLEAPEDSWSPSRRRLNAQMALLIRALRSPEESVQELAIVQISLFGPKVVSYLTAALEAALDDVDLRQSSRQSVSNPERGIAGICVALGIIGDSDSVMDIAAALPRREAVEALAKIGGERALELIMDTLKPEPGPGGPLWMRSADADPAFVRHVFLLFGELGRRRLQDELARRSGQRRAIYAEILRIMDAKPQGDRPESPLGR